MHLIDSHCHLCHGRLLGQVSDVLTRASQAGVEAIVCAVGDLEESKAALGLLHRMQESTGAASRAQPRLVAMAGVHPHEAKDFADNSLPRLRQLCQDAGNVAVGEIGLDYHYDFSPRSDQQRVFAQQLQLAVELGKPVVVHTREAFDDTLAIVRDSGIDGRRLLLHSFTESGDAARRALDLGATISFSGIVTFTRSAELQQTARLVGLERMLIETDAPYLSPEPVRKMKTNEPANVAHVAAFLAKLLGRPFDEVAQVTALNTRAFFDF